MFKLPRYFSDYGGLNSMVVSKYFWGAVLLTLLCAGYFLRADWWSLVINVIPGLVGFSIAGVAIFVSLGSDKLRASIAGKFGESDTENSPFIDFMSMFTHFIVVQLLALLIAVLSKAIYESRIAPTETLLQASELLRQPFWIAGGLLFFYAILLCIGLAVEIYRLALMIDEFQSSENARLGLDRKR